MLTHISICKAVPLALQVLLHENSWLMWALGVAQAGSVVNTPGGKD